MPLSNSQKTFIELLRLGIGNTANSLPEILEWNDVKTLAENQGLSAVVLDGIDTLPENQRPSQTVLLNWIGEALQMESTYQLHQEVAIDMANLFHNNHIRTYVLKGRILSECYPKPAHRASVDMDCFLLPDKGEFDAWILGNNLIKNKGFQVSTGFYKNSSFELPGLMVENHQYLTPFRGNKKLACLEKLLQKKLRDDSLELRDSSEVDSRKFEGTWLYRPPVMVSALFLIEHAYSHFLHEGLTWRMVLDWVLFSKKHNSEINWTDFEVYVDEFGFRKFYDSFNRLGKYLVGELQESSFSIQEKMMLADVWAPLDLHETLHGVKAKFQLAGNYWRARWKYKYFTNMTWVRALYEWVTGAVFDRHPTLQ